eukprot:g55892.t1
MTRRQTKEKTKGGKGRPGIDTGEFGKKCFYTGCQKVRWCLAPSSACLSSPKKRLRNICSDSIDEYGWLDDCELEQSARRALSKAAAPEFPPLSTHEEAGGR